MLVGYMRVSKADGSQTVDLQRDALLAAGVDADHLYDDHASGRRDDRPGLAACLKALREGDTLVVWKLDRLGRNLHHLINTVHDLTGRGVGLKVLRGATGSYTGRPFPAVACSTSAAVNAAKRPARDSEPGPPGGRQSRET
jgi:DNA invertase Pin-like site-specific DNA recombinase